MAIVDTNVLLNNPSVILEEKCYISIRVIEELDRLKNNINADLAFRARRASRMIQSSENTEFILDRKDKLSVDDEIIWLAKKLKKKVITNDLNMKIKCRARGIECSSYEKTEKMYNGITYYSLPLSENKYHDTLAKILSTKQPPEDLERPLYENEFLIIQDSNNNNEIVVIFMYYKGNLEMVDRNYFNSSYLGKITSRNIEQECLMALLNKTEITILLATGGMGVGKSLLTTAYALQELERGAISKVIYVPNNSFTENTREIGALPGTLEEKEELFLGTLYDMIGGYSVDRLINQDQLEVAPISTMRGRNFTDSIIIVNEAQNLTDKHIKLLISRCGENCRIFFDGDIRQSDSYIFREKNGLVLLNKLKDSEDFGKLFGTVRLVQTERSKTAQAAGYLDTVK